MAIGLPSIKGIGKNGFLIKVVLIVNFFAVGRYVSRVRPYRNKLVLLISMYDANVWFNITFCSSI